MKGLVEKLGPFLFLLLFYFRATGSPTPEATTRHVSEYPSRSIIKQDYVFKRIMQQLKSSA